MSEKIIALFASLRNNRRRTKFDSARAKSNSERMDENGAQPVRIAKTYA